MEPAALGSRHRGKTPASDNGHLQQRADPGQAIDAGEPPGECHKRRREHQRKIERHRVRSLDLHEPEHQQRRRARGGPSRHMPHAESGLADGVRHQQEQERQRQKIKSHRPQQLCLVRADHRHDCPEHGAAKRQPRKPDPAAPAHQRCAAGGDGRGVTEQPRNRGIWRGHDQRHRVSTGDAQPCHEHTVQQRQQYRRRRHQRQQHEGREWSQHRVEGMRSIEAREERN